MSRSPRRQGVRRRHARSTARCWAWRSCRSPRRCAARGGCWFKAGDQELHVGVEEPFAPARKAHPGFVVDDLAALEERLRAAGHEPAPRSVAAWHRPLPRRRPVRQPAGAAPGISSAACRTRTRPATTPLRFTLSASRASTKTQPHGRTQGRFLPGCGRDFTRLLPVPGTCSWPWHGACGRCALGTWRDLR